MFLLFNKSLAKCQYVIPLSNFHFAVCVLPSGLFFKIHVTTHPIQICFHGVGCPIKLLCSVYIASHHLYFSFTSEACGNLTTGIN
jgi:hypothetical protein